ncbi:hypothetical protein EDB83DRAFT_143354 [Lactarius deliciosus]|nr:hypothetical protein EDB83DRAFT_143354 [Lactarius deliciosus]
MSIISEPLKKQRLVALALCWVWSVVAACVGLNALIKTNQTKTHFQKLAPPGVILEFHINDIYQSGVVVTTVCAAVAVTVSKLFFVTIKWPARSTGSLKIQAWILTFFSAWILATQIPYTIFTANHHAKVDAFLGSVQIPPATLQATLVAEGLSDKYSKLHHAVLLAIFPWITLLFTAILVAVLFAAARRRDELETASQSSMVEREKGSLDG